jgi:integrase
MLHIEESLSRIPGEKGPNGRAKYGSPKPHDGPPKSDASRRSLELPAELVRALKAWKVSRHPLFKQPDAYVFSSSTGKPLHRAYLTKGLHAACDRAGAPKIGLHGCRHSFASILIARGKPPTQVAELLGHADAKITIEKYAHWFKGASSRSTMEEIAGAMLSPTAVVGERW